MSFSIDYSKLFHVDILHEYFLNRGKTLFEFMPVEEQNRILSSYNLHDHFEIFPLPETERIMKGMGLIFRQSKKGFFLGVRLDSNELQSGNQIPYYSFENYVSFVFGLRLKDPNLLNYTNLRLKGNGEEIYYFSNLVNNPLTVAGGAHQSFLSLPVQEFETSEAYQAGDLYLDGPQLFEANQHSEPASLPDPAIWHPVIPNFDPIATYESGDTVFFSGTHYVLRNATAQPPGSTTDWEEVLPANQYVTYLDRLLMRAEVFSIDFSPLNEEEVAVQLLRPGDNEIVYNQLVVNPFGGNLEQHPVRFHVPSGKYILQLATAGGANLSHPMNGPFILGNSISKGGLFALIEIVHHKGNSSADAQLLNGNLLKTPVPTFQIRFHNRSTYWRYIFNKDQADANLGEFEPDVEAPPIGPPPVELRKFRTILPKPLTKTYLTIKKFEQEVFLPNPSVGLIKPKKEDNKIYSEIYINS